MTTCTPSPVERVQIRRQRRHQRLALAGAHLGDAALVQRDAADELHVEVAHPERAPRGLAHHGEGFGQKLVERLACLQALAEFVGLGAAGPRRSERLDRRLRGALAARDVAAEGAQQPLVAAAEEAREEVAARGCPSEENPKPGKQLRNSRPGARVLYAIDAAPPNWFGTAQRGSRGRVGGSGSGRPRQESEVTDLR